MNSPAATLSLIAISAFSSLNAATVAAVLDPNDLSYDTTTTSNGGLSITSGTLSIDMDAGTMISSETGLTYNSVLTSSETGTDDYKAFTFTSFSITSGVIITIEKTDNSIGLALLSQGDFTLGVALDYSDATQGTAYGGGNISLVSNGLMTLSSTIWSNGADQRGNDPNGYAGGTITIASGGNVDAAGATIQATGGDSKKNTDSSGGDGGDIYIFANSVTGLVSNDIDNSPGLKIGTGTGGDGTLGDLPIDGGIVVGDTVPVYLSAVPEPSSSLMIAVGSLFFFSRRRRVA